MVEDFLNFQAIHLNTSEKGNSFLMFICGFTVAVILYNIFITYLTPIVEINMAKWL